MIDAYETTHVYATLLIDTLLFNLYVSLSVAENNPNIVPTGNYTIVVLSIAGNKCTCKYFKKLMEKVQCKDKFGASLVVQQVKPLLECQLESGCFASHPAPC